MTGSRAAISTAIGTPPERPDRLDKTATGKNLKQGYKEPAVLAGAWDREAAGYVVPR
jgi:hypothetical protein